MLLDIYKQTSCEVRFVQCMMLAYCLLSNQRISSDGSVMNFNPRALNLPNKIIVYFSVFLKKVEILHVTFFLILYNMKN